MNHLRKVGESVAPNLVAFPIPTAVTHNSTRTTDAQVVSKWPIRDLLLRPRLAKEDVIPHHSVAVHSLPMG